jgi:hypothetical protein
MSLGRFRFWDVFPVKPQSVPIQSILSESDLFLLFRFASRRN